MRQRQPLASSLSPLSAAPPSLRRALPASSHAAKCCPNSHHLYTLYPSPTAQHGHSLNRQEQLLPCSLSLQPVFRCAGSSEGLFHHIICAIEPAPRKLCAESQPPFDHLQHRQRPYRCPVQASTLQTCIHCQPACAGSSSTRDPDLESLLRPQAEAPLH
jgi:hypothetical protein